jgi:cytochrome c553
MTRSLRTCLTAAMAVIGLTVHQLGAAQSGVTQSGATQSAPTGDAGRGKTLAYTCLGCHASEGYKNVQPMYSVPRLHGQSAAYLVAALKGYKSGERSHMTMHAHAMSMSDQNMWDIATYIAGPTLKSEAVKAVGTAPPAAQVCVACHGNNGVGITPDYPILAGQYRDYLVRTLKDYQRGGRKNAVMASFMAALKPADIEALAAYYAAQKPGLAIVPKRMSMLSAR